MQTYPSFFSITPATVRYDARLSGDAKILYGELSALCCKEGYCWATNEYLADLYKVDIRTIQRWLLQLKEAGHITAKTDKAGQRRIFLTIANAVQPVEPSDKSVLPPGQICHPPMTNLSPPLYIRMNIKKN